MLPFGRQVPLLDKSLWQKFWWLYSMRKGGDMGLVITLVFKVLWLRFLMCWLNWIFILRCVSKSFILCTIFTIFGDVHQFYRPLSYAFRSLLFSKHYLSLFPWDNFKAVPWNFPSWILKLCLIIKVIWTQKGLKHFLHSHFNKNDNRTKVLKNQPCEVI